MHACFKGSVRSIDDDGRDDDDHAVVVEVAVASVLAIKVMIMTRQ